MTARKIATCYYQLFYPDDIDTLKKYHAHIFVYRKSAVGAMEPQATYNAQLSWMAIPAAIYTRAGRKVAAALNVA